MAVFFVDKLLHYDYYPRGRAVEESGRKPPGMEEYNVVIYQFFCFPGVWARRSVVSAVGLKYAPQVWLMFLNHHYKDNKFFWMFPGCGAFPRGRYDGGLKRVLCEECYLFGALFFPIIVLFFSFQNMKYVSSPGIGQFMLAIILGL